MSHEEATAWQQLARCRNEDPEFMQPEFATPEQVEEAKAVCIGCEVRVQCRELAKGQPAAYGVHAGEWWGEGPRRPKLRACGWCEGEMDDAAASAEYCSTRCRVAAHRARRKSA